MRTNFLPLVLLLFTIGCVSKTKKEDTPIPSLLRYAKGFTITPEKGYTKVTVNTPYKNAEKSLTYILYKAGTPQPKALADAYVKVPVPSIVCTSTTHIPLLDYLGETDKLVGFPTTDYISSTKMRKRIEAGKVAELGIDQSLNIEKLLSLNPGVVMAYTMSSDFGQFSKINEAGIPVLINAEYLEPHPLGRAEWIKLAGLLFDKQAEADSVFSTIEQNYLEIQKRVLNVAGQNAPTVMSGTIYGDAWYAPGGQNYAGKLLDDAGFNYLWKEDTTSGFLALSYESVLEKAQQATYWIGAGSYSSLAEMREANEKYLYFNPFKTQQVYSYNKRMGAKGGSEFLELGYLRPDLILKDLVKIGHPELLPEHELYFYYRMPPE